MSLLELYHNDMSVCAAKVRMSGSPEEFATLIRAEIERWGKLVREAGIKPG